MQHEHASIIATTASPLSSLESDPLVGVDAVRKLLGGVGTATVYRFVRQGKLPRPIKVGSLTKWRRSWIEQSVADLEAAR